MPVRSQAAQAQECQPRKCPAVGTPVTSNPLRWVIRQDSMPAIGFMPYSTCSHSISLSIDPHGIARCSEMLVQSQDDHER